MAGPEQIEAVFWDMGGVLTDSPFHAFAAYERSNGLPTDFMRTVNSTDPDTNAWARLERGEIGTDEFDRAFATESAAAGHRVSGGDVLDLLSGSFRATMFTAVEVCRRYAKVALLTNNVMPLDGSDPEIAGMLDRFEVVCQSSEMGCRKPDPSFYRIACHRAGVDPTRVVFLDDLGVNLKPARALGMHTIKVVDPDEALSALAEYTGWPVTARELTEEASGHG